MSLAGLLHDRAAIAALWLSLRVAIGSVLLLLAVGLPLAYALARPGWRGRGLLDAIVTLPLVFPPVATGFLLLTLLGRRSWLGQQLQAVGIEVIFAFPGILLASVIAGLPLVVKPVQAALESVSTRLGEAARTLGKNEWSIFLHVLLPNIHRPLLAGLVLGLARSLGEVGITLMLGGNISERTATISLEIFNAVGIGDFDRAIGLSALLGGISLVLFLALRRLQDSNLRL